MSVLLILVMVAVTGLFLLRRARGQSSKNPGLGVVSDQWLAEQRLGRRDAMR